jgi:hypothetical protein
MKANFHTALIIFILFAIAIAIRIPLLNRPLSKHHEFCTAIALRILKSWEENGIRTMRFKPSTNYGRPQDKFINNFASASGRMTDGNGNYFYTSHPPLAYYVPYGIFHLLGIKADVLPIQLFHVFVHLLCAFGVYLLIHFLYFKPDTINIPALISCAVYLFNPATLWFQGNVYMSDMFVQLFFVWAVVICVPLMKRQQNIFLKILLLFLLCFAMVYTSWLGVFFCIVAVVLCFRGQLLLSLALIEIFVTSLALGLAITYLQYARIAGIEALKEEWLCRFNQRSSFGNGLINFLLSEWGIIKNYFFNYAALYGMLIIGAAAVYYARKKIYMGVIARNIMAVSVLPILFLHLFLADYSGHDFTVLYAALPFSILAGFFAERAYTHIATWKILLFVTLFSALSAAQFYYINRPGNIAQNGDRYDVQMKEGSFINQNVEEDEVVFALDYKPLPELIWYAGKNILYVHSEEEAQTFLDATGQHKGIIFLKENNELRFFRITH